MAAFPIPSTQVSRVWADIDFHGERPDPDSANPDWITRSSGDGITGFVGLLRLHNRASLLGSLVSRNLDLKCADDAEIVLSAYQKWGERCPLFLLGNFSFGIWDSMARQLFCCRDHLGSQPFYYWHNGSRFICAPYQSAILSSPGVARDFNRRKLAGLTVTGGLHFHDEETFYRGILSLPSGTCMVVDQTGIRKWRYWEPEMPRITLPGRDEEIFEALRELLFTAVGDQLRGQRVPGALLSGGLDSSAVVAIAARHLGNSNRGLLTLSSVLPPGSPAGLRDEREYIREFSTWPNVRLEYITADGRGPFDHIEDERSFEAGFTRTSRYYLYEAFQEAAAAQDVSVLLDGLGGEMGPTCWGGEYYLELAARLRWTRLADELGKLRKVQGTHPVRALGGPLFSLLRPNRDFRPSLLWAPEFLRECEVLPAARRHWPNHRRSQLEKLLTWRRRHANISTASPEEIGYRYPLLDKRVVEFCLAAPTRLKVRDGYQRYLVRGALDGVLPRKIQWRTSKQPFAPDYFVRFNSQLGKARDFVGRIGTMDPVRSVVDVEKLKGLLKPVDPVEGTWEALVSIPATIYLTAFLRQFSEFRQ